MNYSLGAPFTIGVLAKALARHDQQKFRRNKRHLSRAATQSDGVQCGARCISCCCTASDEAQPDPLRAIAADYHNRAAGDAAEQVVHPCSGIRSSHSSNASDDGQAAGFCWLVGAGPGALEHLTVGS